MTTEEKAKAYDEALERAKERHKVCVVNDLPTTKKTIEAIFPELAVSEDERIRKEIIEYLKLHDKGENDYAHPMFSKWFAYLEKQKENPKSANSIPADCASNAKCEDRWHKTANSLPDNGRDVLAKDALGNYLLASFDGAQWFVSVYDGEDHPVLHTPPILEWCDIHSEKQKEPHYTKRNALFDKCVENCDPEVMKEVSDKVDEMLQKEQKPIVEVFGFKVGDAVRLKNGDGRKYIIKSFEEVKGIHGPNFYHVEFEDDSARDGIYPGEEYPNGYYTQMEKFEEEQKPTEPSDEELERHQKELYDFKVFAAKQAKEHHISFVHDFEWNNFCAELLSYFNEQKLAEWDEL